MIAVIVGAVLATGAIGYLAVGNRRLAGDLAAATAQVKRYESQPAVVAHEIRTPLSLIEAAAELLIGRSPGPLNPTQEGFVNTIFDNAQQAIGIAENSLVQRRFKDGNLRLRSDLVDIRDVVAHAAQSLRRTTDVPILVDVRGGILPLYADEQLIRQLVWNLVNNAIRHAEGEDGVHVRVTQAEHGGALLEVTDHGNGMDSVDLENFFTAFATGSSRRPGSGIGMLVSQEIVDAHGGRMMVDSRPDIGTTIVVVLPQGHPERGEQ
ncbi:sensor histidine kinase [Trueperella pecoris]|uniref:histidine kinase n=1 Tax=Trueperella pecoris TaxID=2733571 RepID=A0A7M1QW11_9ACTO|nr:ATP-binding protein [Trueperella pecoris]QOQ39064.1 sensor histidine kinase [Trueperella pecoris]QOR46302.1 sensor histidine kinase [Trueperella pecoris]QTG76128.1 sensor histidine kinase [Trueperella pecoris]